tara:strand:+ start:5838 stop:6887 length:1050 start_codon:yes stop_codon:yes gene_type:complete
MRILSLEKTIFYIVLIFSIFVIGCSFHYDKGMQLEKEERWEEAAIEYHLASIENPKSLKILRALKRVYKNVSKENFEAYKSYLKEEEYNKAYKRLEAAINQDPGLSEAILEKKKWTRLLITGKIEFEFNKLFSNLRLADEMILQVKINTPKNKILTANISNETGIFFIEELDYGFNLTQIAEYTINCIGLKIKRKTPSGIIHDEFKKFVNFRELSPIQVIGKVNKNTYPIRKNILDHRPSLITDKKDKEAWYPPSLLSYKLQFKNNIVNIISESNRNEFAPSIIYFNKSEFRVSIDFGVNKLKMNELNRKWSIQRRLYRSKEDDYYYSLASNLTLYPYFFFDSIFQFDQ